MAPLAKIILAVAAASPVSGAKLRGEAQGPFVPWGGKASGLAPGSDEPQVEMIKHTDIIRKPEEKCICKVGTYFNFKEQGCLPHEDVGFECSSFPVQHHGVICKDGYTCKGAAPVCSPCADSDNCLKGAVRHKVNCLKENHLSGNACVTVRVTLPAVTVKGKASVTEKVESEGKASVSATATATASHTATETDLATGRATAKRTESVHVLEKGKAEAQMDVVTREGSGDAVDRSSVKEGSISVAEGNAKATASAEGTGKRYGTSIATEERTATKTVNLDYSASASKTASSSSEAEASSLGVSLGSACVSAPDAVGLAKAGTVTKEGVVAGRVQLVGLKKAYELAVAMAMRKAKENGYKTAKGKAEAIARKEASETARSTAKADAAAAAYEKAQTDGQKEADKKAKGAAYAEAKQMAKAAAEESARKQAREKAQKYADEDADSEAKRRASAKARRIAGADASNQAIGKAEQEAYVNAQGVAANTAERRQQEEVEAEKRRNKRLRKQRAEEEYEAKVAETKARAAREGKAQKMDGKGDDEAIAKISRPGGILRA
eukprot:TRINITY_DN80085_c0_g1_i1.p1 TRINITY_DN80085_c0_g1~~TRINITY_DN80085_c0_g1_i1.p1  ORF type:complete len:552 (+),score=196.84 TRINITY_DN80085_c0_g1_i1:131-1786(+)